METAKVDIRKLQVLNDRINQCIDALNQVRLSVHGLSHTAGLPGIAGSNLGVANPGFGAGFGAGIGAFGQPVQGYAPGFSHTGGWGPLPAVNPFLGLSHSSPEMIEAYGRPAWADPFLAARLAQTFPYLQYPTPVVGIY